MSDWILVSLETSKMILPLMVSPFVKVFWLLMASYSIEKFWMVIVHKGTQWKIKVSCKTKKKLKPCMLCTAALCLINSMQMWLHLFFLYAPAACMHGDGKNIQPSTSLFCNKCKTVSYNATGKSKQHTGIYSSIR